MSRLLLPSVTLCAAASVNVDATVFALQKCLEQIAVGRCLFFTDATFSSPPQGITVVPIPRINSAHAYSRFLLEDLVDHIDTQHCLIVQWDGFVIDASAWDERFLDVDYVGAPWPQFRDGHSVGNGGFSLRSRKLMTACRDPSFVTSHPEDVAICRVNRQWLEQARNIQFASLEIASRFAYERGEPPVRTFGFHGIFNMIRVLGADQFWALYQSLDDRRTAYPDYAMLMRQLSDGRHPWRRRLWMLLARMWNR